MWKITAPNDQYSGLRAGVQFRRGVGYSESAPAAWFARHGYTVEKVGQAPEDAPVSGDGPVDSRDVGTVHAGASRDGAVDPRPWDFMPPTNAGQADPHGPLVVSPGAHAVPPAPIVPGPVSPEPEEQQARETEVAEQVLVEGAPATVVASRPAKSATKEAWVTYAVSQGATEDEARAMKKDELVERYGEQEEVAE